MEQTNDSFASGINNPTNTEKTTIGWLPLGDLITASWQITIKKYWQILQIQLIPAVVNILFVGIFLLSIVGTAGVFGLLTNGDNLVTKLESLSSLLGFSGIIGIVILIGSIVLYIIQIWSYAAVMHEIISDKQNGLIENYQKGWKKIWHYWWAGVIVGAAVLAGSIFFIIPGIIVAIWFCLAEYIVFTENTNGAEAVARSKKYVEGQWWQVFFRILLLIAIVFVVYVITLIINGGLKIVFTSIQNNTIIIIWDIAERIILFFVTTLIMTFSRSYNFLMYKNLREKKGEISQVELSSTQKWVYNGIPALFLGVIFLVMVFAGYAIWFTVKNNFSQFNNLSSSSMSNNQTIENDQSLVSQMEDDFLTTKNIPIDDDLNGTVNNLQTALETFYTIKGYYPYTQNINVLWTGEDKILNKEISLDDCGKINEPTNSCALWYQWVDQDHYRIIITQKNGEQKVITNQESGEEDLTIGNTTTK